MKLLAFLLLLLAVTLTPAGHRRGGRVQPVRRLVRVVRTRQGPKVVRPVPAAATQP